MAVLVQDCAPASVAPDVFYCVGLVVLSAPSMCDLFESCCVIVLGGVVCLAVVAEYSTVCYISLHKQPVDWMDKSEIIINYLKLHIEYISGNLSNFSLIYVNLDETSMIKV